MTSSPHTVGRGRVGISMENVAVIDLEETFERLINCNLRAYGGAPPGTTTTRFLAKTPTS